MAIARADPQEQLEQLLGCLDSDPYNASLLVDAAEAAIDARRTLTAVDLLERAAQLRPAEPRERHLAALAAMYDKQFDKAAESFAALIAEGHDEPALRFNLSWSRAMLRDLQGALDVLGENTSFVFAHAASLDIQLRHAIGDLETAFERGKQLLKLFPDDRALNAAMSVLALDIGDEDFAAACARQIPDHPDALATMGLLTLGTENATGAEAMFDQSLRLDPGVARAWIGRGLARLMTGKTDQAPADIDRGAELFEDHLGSWIAAGWAHFAAGDVAASRARFEHALSLDPNFAEIHGSLAVLDILAGDLDNARERAKIARRLDPNGYSGALAKAMLTTGGGNPEHSRAIIERAMHTPIEGSNQTLAQALARMGFSSPTIF